MLTKKALISGITGQDGSYLAELLVEQGYEVHGIVRRVAIEDPEHRLLRIRHLEGKVTLHPASLESYPSLFQVVSRVRPDEIYHLACPASPVWARPMVGSASTRTLPSACGMPRVAGSYAPCGGTPATETGAWKRGRGPATR